MGWGGVGHCGEQTSKRAGLAGGMGHTGAGGVRENIPGVWRPPQGLYAREKRQHNVSWRI